MAFKIFVVENVVYTSWHGFTADELRYVAMRIGEVRRATGRGVVYVARIPAGGGVFSEQDDAVLQDYLIGILPSCLSIHHIIEGDGFVKSARLATVNNFARVTSRARDFVVHETLEGAIEAIRASCGVDLRERIGSKPPVEKREERASSAFRAAARIAETKKPRK